MSILAAVLFILSLVLGALFIRLTGRRGENGEFPTGTFLSAILLLVMFTMFGECLIDGFNLGNLGKIVVIVGVVISWTALMKWRISETF